MKNSNNHKDEKSTHQSSSTKSPSSDTVKKDVVPTPADKSKKPPQQQPSDNTMRQQKQQKQHQREPQQQQSSPVVDVIKAKWQKHVGAAKVVWGKLTDDELLQCEGQVDKLSGLVRERYAISRYEADNQVKNFLDKCKN